MITGGLRTKGITKSSRPGEPLISVVTVVYNGVATLEQTIRSVTGQTYGNVEYIIIDGGSTDGTLDIIREYEDKIDWWQSEPDDGIYDAMNKALGLAEGDFLIFMGADDTFLDSGVVAKFVALTAGRNQDKCFYGNVIMTRDGSVYCGKLDAFGLSRRNICHQAIFYSRKVYSSCRYDTSYRVLADKVYNIRNFQSLEYVDMIVSVFNNVTGFSSTAPYDRKFRFTRYFLYMRYFGIFIALKNIWLNFICKLVKQKSGN